MAEGKINMHRAFVKNAMNYKGYVGSVEFSEEDSKFYGKVRGVRAMISYEGETADELVNDFHAAVDDYLSLCAAEGEQPELTVLNLQLLKELETGKLSGEENGWLTSDEVRKHFAERKENEFGYTESDSGN